MAQFRSCGDDHPCRWGLFWFPLDPSWLLALSSRTHLSPLSSFAVLKCLPVAHGKKKIQALDSPFYDLTPAWVPSHQLSRCPDSSLLFHQCWLSSKLATPLLSWAGPWMLGVGTHFPTDCLEKPVHPFAVVVLIYLWLCWVLVGCLGSLHPGMWES